MATSTPTSPLLSPIPPPPPILPQKSQSQSKQNEPDPLLKSQPKFELSPQTLNLLKHKKHEQGKKLQQFKLELLVPFHIPIPCHANVSSMVALLKHFDTNDDDNTTKDKKSDKSLSSSSFPTDYKVHKVPPVVNQLKGIQSKCQVYQLKAKEYHQKAKEAEQLMEQYKQLLQQQQQKQQQQEESERQQSPIDNIPQKTLSLSKIETQMHQSKKITTNTKSNK
jgi:hypothetical protein